jgi:hypothetical protein
MHEILSKYMNKKLLAGTKSSLSQKKLHPELTANAIRRCGILHLGGKRKIF